MLQALHCPHPLLHSSGHWHHWLYSSVQHCIFVAPLQGPLASCSAASTASHLPAAESNITKSLLPVFVSHASSSHSPTAVQGNVQHFVFVASAGAYVPDGLHAGHQEGDKRKSSAGHVAVENYLKEEGLPFTVFQPHYIYGPHTAKVRSPYVHRGLRAAWDTCAACNA